MTKDGFSLIEMLVVVTVFVVIGLITSETIILVLTSTHKADSISKVRQNLDYAMEVMDRQLHNAKSVAPCPNTNTSQLTFVDKDNNSVTFSCVGVNNNNLPSSIASSSGAITASNIVITSCSFVCSPGVGSAPPSVTISVTAQQLVGGNGGTPNGSSNSSVSSTTQITLRTY